MDKKEPALFVQRLFALGIDMALRFPLAALIFFCAFELRSGHLALFFTIPFLLYRPIMEYFFGSSVGKMIMRIRVVDKNDVTLGSLHTFARHFFILGSELFSLFYLYIQNNIITLRTYDSNLYILLILSTIFFILYILSCLSLLGKTNGQTWHDHMGQAFVLKNQV